MGARGEVFSVNRSSLIQIHSVLDIQIPGGTWQLAAVSCPVFCPLRQISGCCEPEADLLAITAGALAFRGPLLSPRSEERLREFLQWLRRNSKP
jgi:hypothetical protein